MRRWQQFHTKKLSCPLLLSSGSWWKQSPLHRHSLACLPTCHLILFLLVPAPEPVGILHMTPCLLSRQLRTSAQVYLQRLYSPSLQSPPKKQLYFLQWLKVTFFVNHLLSSFPNVCWHIHLHLDVADYPSSRPWSALHRLSMKWK